MAEIIRYEQVDIHYNGARAVHDVSFSVAEGEILGIVGESGSGKSTLLKAAMGMLGREGLVTRGDIYYKGLDLPDISDKERQKISGAEIGMIFQQAGSSFCPIRRIGTQIKEMMAAHGYTDARAVEIEACELLHKFGFAEPKRIFASYPFELSGGMQQRAAVAAAMLLKPKILLADEPTSALDVTVQKQVIEEMLLARELFGTAIILVTHNIGVIRAMADTMLVLHQGEVMEYGKAKEILNSPQSPYTQKLLAAVPRLRRSGVTYGQDSASQAS
ncbi:ABC transporter ATP-binding protein [Selenomonas ruminantium]|uniref:ABC transporter ATP-binding protein n=1 Tax=Selenomonas ruminantium TaxID=971 RepID=UPI000420ADE2|nr:ABC transporter ATP-binding protein [Selenomonas ruminantium]